MLKYLGARIRGLMVDIGANDRVAEVRKADCFMSEIILLDRRRQLPVHRFHLEFLPMRHEPNTIEDAGFLSTRLLDRKNAQKTK